MRDERKCVGRSRRQGRRPLREAVAYTIVGGGMVDPGCQPMKADAIEFSI
jgi:hypothetical protein